MEIKTKHDINEKRWVLRCNEVQSIHIDTIYIECEEGWNPFSASVRCQIRYKCMYDTLMGFRGAEYCAMSEEDLEEKTYATKEELIKHL